ncbi:hypothetical protein ETB97_007960, partial [Aspergillus alliaceus]
VDSPDVTFGAIVPGRQAPVPGIEDVAGPTIATVPLRILIRGTVDELLHQQRIRQISQDAKYACDSQTDFLIHPSIEDRTVESPVFENGLNEQETGSGSEKHICYDAAVRQNIESTIPE